MGKSGKDKKGLVGRSLSGGGSLPAQTGLNETNRVARFKLRPRDSHHLTFSMLDLGGSHWQLQEI